jgi:Mrp family chromosome partitioning ATPase
VLLLKDFADNNSAAACEQNLFVRVTRGDAIEPQSLELSGPELRVGYLMGPVNEGAPDPKKLSETYAACRANFELTFVDCSPATGGRYLELIPSAADGIILVVRAESTRPVVVQYCRDIITQRGGVVHCVVLNFVKRYIPGFIYRLI